MTRREVLVQHDELAETVRDHVREQVDAICASFPLRGAVAPVAAPAGLMA